MAGYITTTDGDLHPFHAGDAVKVLNLIAPGKVRSVQLDCDELDWGLNVWPEAQTFTPDQGKRVQVWRGAQARRFVVLMQGYALLEDMS
jgi:hypothetical protein